MTYRDFYEGGVTGSYERGMTGPWETNTRIHIKCQFVCDVAPIYSEVTRLPQNVQQRFVCE